MNVWNGLLDGLRGVLEFFHGVLEPTFGEHSWGWAIILLTVTVRLVLLPLAIKQIRSQRAMQSLQPEMKKIQAKYKADRGLMKTDPEKYKDLRTKQQAAMMALYKEHGVNPASGCLPLIAQMPIFFALFQVLRSSESLNGAPFYLLSNLSETVTQAGPSAWFLVFLMGLSTFYSSKQMMANTPQTGQQAQQQKIMLYAMPLILTFFSLNLYIGVLLYWVTTNVWTIGQQYVMFRTATAPTDADATSPEKKPPAAPTPAAKNTAVKAAAKPSAGSKTAPASKTPRKAASKAKTKPANETGK